MEYTSFLSFSKKFWWLFLILGIILVVSITAFCCFFWAELYDISAWASMIAGISSYIGSSFLGIIVFYHSWIQVQIQEKKDDILLSIESLADYKNKFFIPIEEAAIDRKTHNHSSKVAPSSTEELNGVTYNYLQVILTNLSQTQAVKIELEGLYFVNHQNEVEKIVPYSIISDFSFTHFLDYNQEATIYVGAPIDRLPLDYYTRHRFLNIFMVFKISDATNRTKYYVVDYVLGETLGISKMEMSESKYKERCKKHGSPIVLTTYNEQFFYR